MKKMFLITLISLVLVLFKASPIFARNCTTNTDCGGREVCELGFGDGINGVCVPSSCLSDADCLEGEKCVITGQTRQCQLPAGGNTPAPIVAPPTGSCVCSGGVSLNPLGRFAASRAGLNLEDICTQHKGVFNSSALKDSCKNLQVNMPANETSCSKTTKAEIRTMLGIPTDISGFGNFEAVCLWRPAYTSPEGTPTNSLQPGCKFDEQGVERCRLENPLGDGPDGTTEVGNLIKQAITVALGVIGAFTLLMFVWGGFQWLTSTGNPEKVSAGTQTMVWAVIGVMVVFASYVLLSTLLNVLTSG